MPQDSSRPDFWDTRYRGNVTPWDAAGVPPALDGWLAGRARGRVLIPGCGSGYEVRRFAAHGDEVLAIDFSDGALAAARRQLPEMCHLLRKADFFEIDESFDLVYERAFLCALPRALWPRWAAQLASRLLEGDFALVADKNVLPEESLPVFRGKEIWQVWRRQL